MNEKFLEVGDVMQILGISRSAAYKLIHHISTYFVFSIRNQGCTNSLSTIIPF